MNKLNKVKSISLKQKDVSLKNYSEKKKSLMHQLLQEHPLNNYKHVNQNNQLLMHH